MRTRKVVLLALVVALVLGFAAVAQAVTPAPTLMASKTALVYPHSAYLKSTVATPSMVMRRLAGSDVWTDLDPVSAAAPYTWLNKPKSTAGYKVVSDGVESETVTITVAAQLKMQINKHGHRWHKNTIKGWVAPKHSADATVALTFYRLEKVTAPAITSKGKSKGKGRSTYQWVKQGDAVDVMLTGVKNHNQSKWSYKWAPTAQGTWKVVVSHEDVAHAFSSTSKKVVIKR
jgi:hypothetical protein